MIMQQIKACLYGLAVSALITATFMGVYNIASLVILVLSTLNVREAIASIITLAGLFPLTSFWIIFYLVVAFIAAQSRLNYLAIKRKEFFERYTRSAEETLNRGSRWVLYLSYVKDECTKAGRQFPGVDTTTRWFEKQYNSSEIHKRILRQKKVT